jgi:predicted nucleic acid-binding protein
VIHLDTSFVIHALVAGTAEDRALRGWLSGREALAMSTVAWTELLCGPIEASHAELAARVVTERIPFVEDDAVLATRLYNQAGRRRGSLIDCMIAAAALRAGASLATTNASDFRRFEPCGLTLAVV